MIDEYGLNDEQRAECIDLVLDERAEVIVDGIMHAIEHNPWFAPRVAHALIRRLTRLYGTE